MKIGMLVMEGPYQHQAVDSAYHFAKAALGRGHEVVGIFLYTDGVNNANKNIKPPGERNINGMLDELGGLGIPVIACSACARFRGLQKEMLSANIRASGLGSLAEFIESADRFVTFGD